MTVVDFPTEPGGTAGGRRLYEWRPGPSAGLPAGFRLAMVGRGGADGLLRFTPREGVETFLVRAAVGGQALPGAAGGPDPRRAFSDRVMTLLFQQARRAREHFGRRFLREEDLRGREADWRGSGRADLLPDRLGLGRGADGRRWSAAQLMGRGRLAAEAAGYPRPTAESYIAAGLLAAARLDPFEPGELDGAGSLALVRLALFDLGPGGRVDDAVGAAVEGRLLEALEKHIDDGTEAFDRWFFGGRDNIVHAIAKRRGGGGPIGREAVRRALLELAFASYEFVGRCRHRQMEAFLAALPEPLGEVEAAIFRLLYCRQRWLGGLPLILLRERFDFLRGAALDVMDRPGDPAAIGALQRMLQYYGEMAAARRESDRAAKRPAAGRRGVGPGHPGRSTRQLFEAAAGRLRDEAGLACACGPAAEWEVTPVAGDGGARIAAVDHRCDRCGRGHRLAFDAGAFGLAGGPRPVDPGPRRRGRAGPTGGA